MTERTPGSGFVAAGGNSWTIFEGAPASGAFDQIDFDPALFSHPGQFFAVSTAGNARSRNGSFVVSAVKIPWYPRSSKRLAASRAGSLLDALGVGFSEPQVRATFEAIDQNRSGFIDFEDLGCTDETDNDEALVVVEGDGWRVDARLPVDDLLKVTGVEAPDDYEGDTVGGLILALAERVPDVLPPDRHREQGGGERRDVLLGESPVVAQ